MLVSSYLKELKQKFYDSDFSKTQLKYAIEEFKQIECVVEELESNGINFKDVLRNSSLLMSGRVSVYNMPMMGSIKTNKFTVSHYTANFISMALNEWVDEFGSFYFYE